MIDFFNSRFLDFENVGMINFVTSSSDSFEDIGVVNIFTSRFDGFEDVGMVNIFVSNFEFRDSMVTWQSETCNGDSKNGGEGNSDGMHRV